MTNKEKGMSAEDFLKCDEIHGFHTACETINQLPDAMIREMCQNQLLFIQKKRPIECDPAEFMTVR